MNDGITLLEQAKSYGHEKRVADMAKGLYIAALGSLDKKECVKRAKEYYKEYENE